MIFRTAGSGGALWVQIHVWLDVCDMPYVTRHMIHSCETWYDVMCHLIYSCVTWHTCVTWHISSLLKIIGLFCKRALWTRPYSAKETYNFKEPTNRSHLDFKETTNMSSHIWLLTCVTWFIHVWFGWDVCVCVWVCVIERERERERAR